VSSRTAARIEATISPEFSVPEATERRMYDALRQRQSASLAGQAVGTPK
jgi:hypothetical protein